MARNRFRHCHRAVRCPVRGITGIPARVPGNPWSRPRIPCNSAFRKAPAPNEDAFRRGRGEPVMFLTERFAAVVRSGSGAVGRSDRNRYQRASLGPNGSRPGTNVTTFGGGLSKHRRQLWRGHRFQDHVIATDLTCPEGLPNVVAGEADHGDVDPAGRNPGVDRLGRPETMYCRKENGPR